jgi:F0F1-type ATP synthase assembly protein I
MTNDKQKNNSEDKPANSYLKFTGLGFQMIAIIGVFTFIGYKIDESFNHSTKWITAIFSLFGVFASLYIVFKSLN